MSLTSDADAGASEQRTLERLQAELDRLVGLRTPEAMLNVERNSNEHSIKQAYAKLAKRWHPQMFARFRSQQVTDLATQVFVALTDAQDQLLEQRASSVPRKVVQHGTTAEPAPRRKLRKRQPTASQTAQMVELSVIKAIRELDSEHFDTAEEALSKAVRLDPGFVKARIWLLVTQARRAKKAGDVAGATAKYRAVLEVDAHWREALEEVGER